jgi:hypothetical protein
MDDTTVATAMAPGVDNPCIIYPNGATAGYDDFLPFTGAGETTTCKELLDDMINLAVEAESDLCEYVNEIEALCVLTCPPVREAVSNTKA